MVEQKNKSIIKYLLISISPYILGLLAEPTLNALYAYLIIFICVVLNHVLLLRVVRLMVSPEDSKRSGKIFFMFFGKATILFFGISLGVHFIGTKVIIPVLFYVFQIFVLIFSLRRS